MTEGTDPRVTQRTAAGSAFCGETTTYERPENQVDAEKYAHPFRKVTIYSCPFFTISASLWK